MATIKPLYGSNNQSVTITLGSLAASATAGRQSAAVDFSSALLVDMLVTLTFETGTVSGNKQVLFYVGGTVDGGSNYTEGLSGADSTFGRNDPSNLRPLAVCPAPSNTTIYKCGPFSVAAAFGGVLPERVAFAVFNDSGAAFSTSTGANNSMHYQGVQLQSV